MRARGRLLGAVAGALVLASATPARAQEAAGDTLVLTLADALRRAEGSNPGYRRTANEVGLNGIDTRTTWATQLLPQARLSLFNTQYTGNLQRIATDNFGNPIANPTSEWTYFSNTTQSLSLGWSIQGPSLFNAFRRQKRTNFDRELAEDRTLAELHANVRRRYFDVLEQRDLLEAERALAEARAVEREIAERRFRLAQASRVDVLNAELAVQEQAAAVARQRGGWEQARLALRTVLGDPDLPPVRLADEPLPVFDPSALDADDLVDRAEGANPSVRQAESAVASAALSVKERKAQWWPDLSFGLNVYRRAQDREGAALFDFSWDEDLDQSFYLSLSVPFFNSYFQNEQSIETAEVQLDNQRESLREARLQAEEQVRSALLDLKSQHESLALATRRAEIAAEALRLAREEYRIGTRTFEQLRQSMQAEADARRQVIQARYAFVDALVTLEQAVGAPVRGTPPVTAPAGEGDGAGARPAPARGNGGGRVPPGEG